ncbi:hypothetical protein KTI63_00040 [Acinetobacter guillouiae]|uniref:hypothetical protein n=1 Tax=Acinetobacter guillouiae TaxID=106649 RepID=UPI0021D0F2E6|nr:hypothetical protein [Acinetobacter guillouiae]MCU4490850.1 hypothetical protein [Acinetobacter guillouiae]
MKKLIAIIMLCTLFVSSCIIKKSNVPTDIVYKEDFNKVINTYFVQYEPKSFNLIDKDVTQYMAIDISKKKMDFYEFQQVQKKLNRNGWKLVDQNDGLFKYCLNEYQILSILFPSKNNHYDSKGNIFKYDDKNNWALELYFNAYGVDYCMGYYNKP